MSLNDNKLLFLKIVAWLLHYFGYVLWFFLKLIPGLSNFQDEKVKAPQSPRTIVITGASQGLGEALAEHYYRNVSSSQRIILISRNREKLEQIRSRLNFHQDKQIIVFVANVTNRDAMKNVLEEIHRLYGEIDVLLANAGVSFRQLALEKSLTAAIQDTFDINIIGVLNTILPLIELKAVRQIGLVSSQAAYAPFVRPIYGTTKQCLVSLGHDLRRFLVKDGIAVNIISPGPIKTAMLVGSIKKSIAHGISPEQAAQIIADGLRLNQIEIVFPEFTGIFQYALSYLPNCVAEPVAEYLLR